MARTMLELSTKVYRTVVRSEFLEDSDQKHSMYDKDFNWVKVPDRRKGDVVTEVFGPYPNKAQNQNYSMIQAFRIVDTGEKLYKRSDHPNISDQWWYGSHYETATRQDYIKIADVKVEHQELKPVFALNANGTLSLELDWVTYR